MDKRGCNFSIEVSLKFVPREYKTFFYISFVELSAMELLLSGNENMLMNIMLFIQQKASIE